MPLRFLALALALLAPSSAAAAELHVLAARAVEKVARMQARAAGSDAADLVIVSVPAAEALERQGAVVGGSRVTLGRGARGDIELAAALVSEIVAIPGLLVVGRLPEDLAPALVYADAGFEP